MRIGRPLLLIVLLCACEPSHSESRLPTPFHAIPKLLDAQQIYCRRDAFLKYREPKTAKLPDRDNLFDTPETVAEIRKHNAALRAACP